MYKVIVTGATGFVGNNLVRLMMEQDIQVVALVRPGSDLRVFNGLDLEIFDSQLDDEVRLSSLLSSSDVLVHAAGHIWLGKHHLDLGRRVNVELTQTLAKLSRQHRVRMIHVSTVDALSAASSPESPCDETNIEPIKSDSTYSITKQEAERSFLEQVDLGLDGLIVNPSFMLGPWDWKPSSGQIVREVCKGWVLFAPGGGISAVDVRDVCRGIISAIEHGRSGERYILAGENLTFLELWQRIAAVARKTWPKYALPNWLAYPIGKLADISRLLPGREVQINSTAISMGQLYNYYSSAKAQAELGYKISPLQPAIEAAYDWLHEYGYLGKKMQGSN
ncbi:MAG TPA: NAD-dependent epimerase/dehydratase family protein [Pirellulaceae bacterium]|nr:NAD-dependent epimerase/dehydratase family protein [Pirellulaceae bacterium]HMO90935.1 NAD-dependent epimerase/dehydratase family protein [Pirellulaceae bacterium]HMP69834.1 NAD-dependent epimerase/dehydratase family protein [Pirellulaceae bacterium]